MGDGFYTNTSNYGAAYFEKIAPLQFNRAGGCCHRTAPKRIQE